MSVTAQQLTGLIQTRFPGVRVHPGWFFKDKRSDGSVRVKLSLGLSSKAPGWTPPDESVYEETRLLLQDTLGIPVDVEGRNLVFVIPPPKEGSIE